MTVIIFIRIKLFFSIKNEIGVFERREIRPVMQQVFVILRGGAVGCCSLIGLIFYTFFFFFHVPIPSALF